MARINVFQPTDRRPDSPNLVFLRNKGGRPLAARLARLSVEATASEDPSAARLARLSVEVLVRQFVSVFIPYKRWPTEIAQGALTNYFLTAGVPEEIARPLARALSRIGSSMAINEQANYIAMETWDGAAGELFVPHKNWLTVGRFERELKLAGMAPELAESFGPPLRELYDEDARLERSNYVSIEIWAAGGASLKLPKPHFLRRPFSSLVTRMVNRGVEPGLARAVYTGLHAWRARMAHKESINYRTIEKWANG